MQVRKATEEDLEFLVHCAISMAFETENKQLDSSIVTSGILHCLQDNSLGTYYVAWKDDVKVGVTMLTYEMSLEVGGQIHWI